MATTHHMQPAKLAPADVCRARAIEARAFALASQGSDVPIWLEVAEAWELTAAAHERLAAATSPLWDLAHRLNLRALAAAA